MDNEIDDWLVRAAERAVAEPVQERDNYSFEDSERFEDDSEYSWRSSESLNQNWRGWANEPPGGTLTTGIMPGSLHYHYPHSGRYSSSSTHTVVGHQRIPSRAEHRAPSVVPSLSELSAKTCARSLSFDEIEFTFQEVASRGHQDQITPSMPPELFLPIVRWCFPSTAEDIRLYSCIANGNGDEFNTGDTLYQLGAVSDVFQIGYKITADVSVSVTNDDQIPQAPPVHHAKTTFQVSLTVDRCRVVSCSCSCPSKSTWCQHVIALCLHRIRQPHNVQYRVTMWESVNALSYDKLKKLAQNLINQLPREVPRAQRLIDQVNDPDSEISKCVGAPDHTDGNHELVPFWALDQQDLHLRVRRLLLKYCIPSPAVHCDVSDLHEKSTPHAVEWNNLLKPLSNREPEGLWNLISIVREMMARGDLNAVSLLRITTEECLANSQILLWWYVTKLVESREWRQLGTVKTDNNANQMMNQLNAAQLCDEVVSLWRCAALNPALDSENRMQIFLFLQNFHRTAVNRIMTVLKGVGQEGALISSAQSGVLLNTLVEYSTNKPWSVTCARFGINQFPGFHHALHACYALQNVAIHGKAPSLVNYLLLGDWDDTACVPLQPGQVAVPTTTKKKKKKSKRSGRARGAGGNGGANQVGAGPSRRRAGAAGGGAGVDHHRGKVVGPAMMPEDDSSAESGQESEQDERTSRDCSLLQEDVDSVLAASYLPMDPFEIRYARCEALACHGFSQQAIGMALDLSKSLVSHLRQDETSAVGSDKPCSSRSILDSEQKPFVAYELARSRRHVDMLEKAHYLANIIRSSHRHDAELFTFVLDVLKFTKFPLSTKFLQVKEYYIECELVLILQQVYIGPKEVEQLRSVSKQLVESIPSCCIPPLALAHFIFDKLHYTFNVCEMDANGHTTSRTIQNRAARKPCDDSLALRVALDALGARVLVPEHEYPMLLEATRKHRAQLSLALLSRYKDSKEKLGLIMDKLLDPHLNRMYNYHLSNAAYFLKNDNTLLKHCIHGQRPVYPYPDEPEVAEAPQRPQSSTSSSESPAENDTVGSLSQRLMKVGSGQRGSSDEDSPRSSTDSDMVPSTSKLPAAPSGYVAMKRWRQNQIFQATEAHAHFMFEFAKQVLVKLAGGSQNTAQFAARHIDPHRNLHICAVLIGIYGLGIHNKISPTWSTRTYSGPTHWITGQAGDIGASAIEIVREIWDGHMTPREVAEFSSKMSNSQDPVVVREAAELALSLLPRAAQLSYPDACKALLQCKDQGPKMLEKACKAVETALQQENDQEMSADLLFLVARYWEELHMELDKPSKQHYTSAAQPPTPQPNHQQMSNYFHQQAAAYHPIMSGYPPVHMPPNSNMIYAQQHSTVIPPMSRLTTSTSAPVSQQHMAPMQQPPPQMTSPSLQGMHQSHSAPQLTSTPPPPMGSSMETAYPRLIQAHRIGMLAMDRMKQMKVEENNKAKYSQHPIYANELKWLFNVSCNLGPVYAFNFLDTACRNVVSPYILGRLAFESVELVKNYVSCGMPLPPMTYGRQQHPRNVSKAYAHVAGQARKYLLDCNYHPTTAELFERCFEQFYHVMSLKLCYGRFTSSDKEDVTQLLDCAHTTYLFLNDFGRRLLGDFFVHVKKQKHGKHVAEIIERLKNPAGSYPWDSTYASLPAPNSNYSNRPPPPNHR